MSKDKEIINKMFTILAKQQEVITKLAQALPPAHLQPAEPTKREAEAILNALPQQVRAVVENIAVIPGRDGNLVKIRYVGNRGSAQAFQAIQRTVTDLQKKNVLAGQTYTLQELA
jgi:hypothetical protein